MTLRRALGGPWLALLGHLLDQVQKHRARRILDQCAAVGRDVRLRMPVVVYDPQSLRLGDCVDIGEFVVLRASGGLTIGSRVLIAAHAVLTTRGHPKTLPRYGQIEDAPLLVEDDVWIGAGAIVLPGVSVGAGAGANGVVSGIVAVAAGALPTVMVAVGDGGALVASGSVVVTVVADAGTAGSDAAVQLVSSNARNRIRVRVQRIIVCVSWCDSPEG